MPPKPAVFTDLSTKGLLSQDCLHSVGLFTIFCDVKRKTRSNVFSFCWFQLVVNVYVAGELCWLVTKIQEKNKKKIKRRAKDGVFLESQGSGQTPWATQTKR